MKHFALGSVTTELVIAIGVWLYLKLGLAEVRGDLPPSRWEISLMTSAAHASVRRRAPEGSESCRADRRKPDRRRQALPR
jgi:hypothetical protein